MVTTQKRTRLAVDVPLDLLTRIRRASADEGTTMSEYVVRLLDRGAPRLHERGSGIFTREDLESIREVSRRVMRGRRLDDDSSEIIREMRDQRTQELP